MTTKQMIKLTKMLTDFQNLKRFEKDMGLKRMPFTTSTAKLLTTLIGQKESFDKNVLK